VVLKAGPHIGRRQGRDVRIPARLAGNDKIYEGRVSTSPGVIRARASAARHMLEFAPRRFRCCPPAEGRETSSSSPGRRAVSGRAAVGRLHR